MKKIFLILLAFIMFAGCEDYLNINEDPNSPTVAPNSQLLPGILVDVARRVSIGGGLGNVATVYSHQGTTREHWNDYGILGTTWGSQTAWQTLYTSLTNTNALIEQAEKNDELIYAGIGKAMKAYVYSIFVDIWGDVPFTQAHDLANYPNPEFDDGRDIYVALFQLLTDAVADLENEDSENVLKPGADDLIYNGSVDKWVRFANTLKLKMYVQVRKTDLWDATAVNALLTGGQLMEDHDDSFMLFFGDSNSPENRHPAFIADYEGGQIGYYNSPWFYEIMMGMNPDIYTGIVDPRVPYYFYMQLTAGEETQNPAEYVHDSSFGRFVSIWFGSIGPNRDYDQRVSATQLGIYPVGGRYSNPADTPAEREEGRATTATGAVPQRMLTYVDRIFLEAELVQLGLATGDAGLLFEKGVEEAFNQVDVSIANAVHSSQEGDVPSLARTNADVETYITAVNNRFVAASAEGRFEMIMTQKWISSAGAPVDQYTDYRRTGYPVIHDPNTDGNDETQRLRNYVLSFPWSNTELTINPNAPEQKDPQTFRVFWDIP